MAARTKRARIDTPAEITNLITLVDLDVELPLGEVLEALTALTTPPSSYHKALAFLDKSLQRVTWLDAVNEAIATRQIDRALVFSSKRWKRAIAYVRP